MIQRLHSVQSKSVLHLKRASAALTSASLNIFTHTHHNRYQHEQYQISHHHLYQSIHPFHTNHPYCQKNLVLYDSLSKSYKPLMCVSNSQNDKVNDDQPFSSTDQSQLGLAWYTCGPTVYDSAHLGHARTYVCMDILHRLLSDQHHRNSKQNTTSTPPPLFIMNITDVDDKILSRSKEMNIDPMDLAKRYEIEFMQDLQELNVNLPTIVTRVSEHVESDIVPYIQQIMRLGFAYIIPSNNNNADDIEEDEAGVYFHVKKFEKMKEYGKLAPDRSVSKESTLKQDGDMHQSSSPSQKIDVRDFALWKFRKSNEDLYWESPWGDGRPGWHIECSAMIEAVMKKFGSTHSIQVHAGGVDLKFPHHTNEIAQAEAYHSQNPNLSQKEWIPHWVHTGHLHIEGSKMSKSLKNFITIREMLSLPQNSSESIFSSPSDDFRLWCIGLSGSYRSLTHYSSTRMQEAKAIREKMVRFILDADEWIQSQKNEGPVTRKWNQDDYIFYQSILTHSEYCNNALIGSIASNRNFDLDGSTFLKELLQIIHLGTTHLQSSYTKPIEPVQYALKTVRELLSLVGFTQRTISPGKQTIDPNFKSYIPGGEEELVGEAIEMRACIRDLALKGMKNNATGEDLKKSMKEILKVCDQARDTKFPSLGIEVFDEKMEEGKTRRDLWRWCNPIEKGTGVNGKTVMNKNSVVIPKNVPYEQYFQKGRYKDMFGDFDETGMPIQKKDGSIVSKSLSKKLAKKRNKFFERNNV